ncbi:MAG: filamentous hemagglutinin N-terminal domain-containing protein [Nostoc sp. ZfuVER08]|nr:S-layer family protein [Nostoc sp. ZfuVER08]
MLKFFREFLPFKLAVSACCCLIFGNNCVLAEITADGTLGSESSILIPGVEVKGEIVNRIDGGAVRGANLFHSFSEFSIGDGQRVYFYNPTGIENILTRVTGNNSSNILGTLGVLGNANLFFINPNGIVFGRNARLDVAGSFVGSTADSLRFDNNFAFSANNPQTPPLLTINVPLGLQFAANPGSILNQSTVRDSNGEIVGLQVRSQRTLALVGGDIFLQQGRIKADGGQIELGSVFGNGVVGFNWSFASDAIPLTLSYEGIENYRDIQLSGRAEIIANSDSISQSIGSVHLQGRRVTLSEESGIFNSNRGSGKPGSVIVNATDLVEMSGGSPIDEDSLIDVANYGSGGGSSVIINTSRLIVGDGSFIAANTRGVGQGGRIIVNASNSVELLGTSLSGFSTGFFATTQAEGKGGNITIDTGRLIVKDGGVVSVSTFNTGDGGELTVMAKEFVELSGAYRGGRNSSGLFAQSNIGATGDAGNLTIKTGQLFIRNGAQIGTSTFSSGNGGTMLVDASKSVEVNGTAIRSDGSRVSSGIFSSVGRRPDVTQPTGKGGDITINSNRLVVEDGGQIQANTFARGAGGTLTLNLENLLIKSGGEVGASTYGEGLGGKVTVNALESIEVSGSGIGDTGLGNSSIRRFNSILSAGSQGLGDSGNLTIATKNLVVKDGGQVTVSGLGIGNPGNLDITAKTISLNEGTLSATTASGSEANIQLRVSDLIRLRNNSSITAQAFDKGNGGNININTNFVVANPKENSDIIANAIEGSGGRINITAQGIFGLQLSETLTSLSDINASSELGINGVVEINTPDVNPSNGLVNLPTNIVDASRLIAQTCRTGGEATANEQSEFIVTGRGGLPPNPIEPLSSDVIWQDLQIHALPNEKVTGSQKEVNLISETPSAIAEAQGWVTNADGTITLVAQAPTATPHNSSLTPVSCPVTQN